MATKATMAKKLPKGWRNGEHNDRKKATDCLPVLVRRLLGSVYAALAIEDAKRVLSKFEERHPDDSRPRKAIGAAEKLVDIIQSNPSAAYAAYAYVSAADSAASAYAYAADSAAYSAYVSAAYSAYASAADSAASAYAASSSAAAAYVSAAAAAAAAESDCDSSASSAAYVSAAARSQRWSQLYTLFTHCRGPVGAKFAPEWQTETAVAVARGIYDERAFDRMPILADAMEEAGCDNAEVLNHLRTTAEGEFTRADWVFWNLFGWGDKQPEVSQ